MGRGGATPFFVPGVRVDRAWTIGPDCRALADSRFIASLAAAGWLALSSVAFAQTAETTTPAQPRIHLGPLGLEPRLALRNLGIDTNVNNDSLSPERDVTATITPELRETMRVGRTVITGTSSVDWHYFRQSAAQRSFNGAQDGRLELKTQTAQPYLFGNIARGRQRPNLEIDARVERTLGEIGGGAKILLGPKLTIDLGAAERQLDYGREAFDGVALAQSLDRKERRYGVKGRLALTPLTTLIVDTEYRRDRFDVAFERDTDTTAALVGLELKPLALLSGRARVGWRRFLPTDSATPDFLGVIADVELTALVRDMTRLTGRVARDVEYSFDRAASYYVSTGVNIEVQQALGSAWDVIARAGRTALDYQSLGSDSRVDHVVVAGGGLGRKVGTDIRVGVDVDRAARRSELLTRRYAGIRVGGSITYGF
jgi:hypothetical protein